MFAISGDVIVQTLGLVIVALIGSGAAIVGAQRARRTEQQMKPNGGATMRDAIDRLDARSTEHDRRFNHLEHVLDGVATVVHRIEGRQTGDTGEHPVTE